MTKASRHAAILKLISTYDIDTQQELTERLVNMGFKTVQATVSRDIKELGLIKTTENQRSKYAYMHNNHSALDKFRRLFNESVLSIRCAQNLIVVRTVAGSANSAAAYIDRLTDKLTMSTILGTIAGDDTILIITETTETALEIAEKLQP